MIDLTNIPDGAPVFSRTTFKKHQVDDFVRLVVQRNRPDEPFVFVPGSELGKWNSLMNPDGTPNNPTQEDWDALAEQYQIGTWGWFWDQVQYPKINFGQLTNHKPAEKYKFECGEVCWKYFRPYSEGLPPHIEAAMGEQPQPELKQGDWVLCWNENHTIPTVRRYHSPGQAFHLSRDLYVVRDHIIPYIGPTPWVK